MNVASMSRKEIIKDLLLRLYGKEWQRLIAQKKTSQLSQ